MNALEQVKARHVSFKLFLSIILSLLSLNFIFNEKKVLQNGKIDVSKNCIELIVTTQ